MAFQNVTDACQWGNTTMMFYQDRLSTFEHWPKQIIPNQYQLARAGFYYTGQYDKVTCFCCNLTVHAWEQNDDPWKEHERLSPSCMYIKMIGIPEKTDKPEGFRPFGCNSMTGNNLFVKPIQPKPMQTETRATEKCCW